MATYIRIAQILVSILLILVILLQVKGIGGGVFGGTSTGFRTRRGLEKTLFQFTIALAAIFIIIAILSARIA